MKKKFNVQIEITTRCLKEVEVVADSPEEARNQIRKTVGGMGVSGIGRVIHDDREFHYETVLQVEGPDYYADFSSGPWYDLHGPDDIIVLCRALGHRFDADDMRILKRRLGSLGLEVVDYWNGYDERTKRGCGQVSFKCKGRKGTGPMSDEDAAKLLAPKAEG